MIKKKEDRNLVEILNQLDNGVKIRQNHKSHVYLRKLVILRREQRFILVEIFIYSMRLILLIGNLKLIGHHYLNPIFVSICGLIQAFTVVFKSMKSKKNFYKLELEDIKQTPSVSNLEKLQSLRQLSKEYDAQKSFLKMLDEKLISPKGKDKKSSPSK